MTNEYIKPPVEIRYKNELDALKSVDIGKKPENWVLSPKARSEEHTSELQSPQ